MGVELSVVTYGFEETMAVIDRALRAQADLTPAWRGIVAQFEGEQEEVFEASGAYGGRPRWRALSDRYRKRKQRLFGDMPILVARGDLAQSLTDSNWPTAVRWIERDSLVIGSLAVVGKKGRMFNLGLLHAVGAGNLPKREAIRPTREQDEAWADIIMKHLFVED